MRKFTTNIGAALLFAVAGPLGVAQLKVPDVHFPTIVGAGKDAAAFAPKGWVVEMQKSGDLNGDGKDDLAFVLHDTEKRNVVTDKDLSAESVDTNPRILCVAMANADGQGFRLVLQNHTLIPRWIYPNQDDNFGEEGGDITIARGALRVGLHYFASMGGWDAGSTTFTFRWRADRFELIGFDNDNLKRNTGTNTKTSVNYSTGRETIVTEETEGADLTKRKLLPKHSLLTIEEVGDGMEFEAPR